jgi:amino acid permease
LIFCRRFVDFVLAFARFALRSHLHAVRTDTLQLHEPAAMMDNNHPAKKGPTTFVRGPEMEGSLSAGDSASAGAGQVLQEEEIKRDLHSRHINMIAIAGMIVRTSLHLHDTQSSP